MYDLDDPPLRDNAHSEKIVRQQYGVEAPRGARLTMNGRPGTLIGFVESHLLVRFDDAEEDLEAHPTWEIVWQREAPCPTGYGAITTDWLGGPCPACVAEIMSAPEPPCPPDCRCCAQHAPDFTVCEFHPHRAGQCCDCCVDCRSYAV